MEKTTDETLPALSPDNLKQLETNAALMFSVKELSIILEIDGQHLHDLVTNPVTPEYAAFHRGRLEAEAKIRQSIYELANNGSSPAQSQFLDLIESAKLDDAL
jgi:hypothetical protein